MRKVWMILLAMMLASAATAAAQSNEELSHGFVVQARNVALDSVASDRVRLRVTLSIKARRDVRLRELRLERLRANGVPFHSSPAPSELTLTAGQEVELPLTVTIYLRELDGFEPIRRAVDEQKITLSGVIYGEVVLGKLTKLLMMTRHVRAAVPVEQQVAFSIPGGYFSRLLLSALLDKAEDGMQRADSLWRKAHDELAHERKTLRESYAPRLVLVRASANAPGEEGSQFESYTTGLRVTGCRVLVSKAAVAPWLFSPELALERKRNAKQVEQSLDIAIWPAGALLHNDKGELDYTGAWRLSKKQLAPLAATKNETEDFYTLDGHDRVKVALEQRSGAAAFAAIDITAAGCDDKTLAAPVAYDLRDAQPSGESYGYFHLSPETARVDPDFVLFTAEQRRAMSELEEPTSAADWGSPVVTAQGVSGVVVDEQKATPLRDLLAEPKLSLPAAPAAPAAK